ncbi:hypothetical protein L6452_18102 [Arctium lappa]|uniref:Uncharacterized protein n=1 Tax=Arctium lappa TaxID=4217 RepID=A0ACB9C5F1_ARCLA|nr:hypothetical protein L6452_18102 [Arctium lappa]
MPQPDMANPESSSNNSSIAVIEDRSHSYFLHYSDSPGMILVSQPLEGDNYSTWSRSMMISLFVKNKTRFIDGYLAKPVSDLVLQNAWIRCNNMVISWLMNSVSKPIASSIMYLDTTYKIWMTLKNRFQDSNGPRIFQIRRDLMNLSQNQDPVNIYFTKLQSLWEELAFFHPHCNCGKCDCGGNGKIEKHYEDEHVLNFLMGLNESYYQIRSQILLMEPLPQIDKVFSLVAQEERQRSVGQPQQQQVINTQSMVLNVKGGSSGVKRQFTNNPSSNSGNRFSSREKPFCTHCQMQGHTKEKCYKLHGYPIGYKSRSRVNNVVVENNVNGNSESCGEDLSNVIKGLSSIQCQQLLSTLSGHLTVTLYLLLKMRIDVMNPQRFVNSRSVSNFSITLPTNESVRVNLIGDVMINGNILLRDVLYVPQFHLNLVSVSALNSDRKYSVRFDYDHGLIQEKEINRTIGKADLCQGLYILNEEEKVYVNQVSAVPLDVWHQRFGHPSNKKLLVIKSLLNVKENSQDSSCIVCPLSKHKRLPFVSLDNVCDKSFDLVHLDTWGPFHMSDKNGHRYFLTLVDDHNRYTWVFLIKNKSDAIQVIPWFYNMALTQFGIKIKAFHTDNAQELSFTNFFLDKGILHQKSCVGRPQQNSVVERKHQHLLNVARSLMFKSKVPLLLWSESILTDAFLINRTPSKTLGDRTPYEILHGKIPDFSMLRTFGCYAFASTLTNERHKFSQRAKACLFVGYPVGMKAYKLMDLETKQVFQSRDVVFHENVFPYKGGQVDKDYDPFSDIVVPAARNDFYEDDERHTTRMEHVQSPENEDELGEPISSEPMECQNESLSTEAAGCNQSENGNRRSSQNRRPPSYLKEYHCNVVHGESSNALPHSMSKYYGYQHLTETQRKFACAISTNMEPSSYKQAAENSEWISAMEEELKAMELNKTWTVVPLPEGKNSVGCRWVYKLKYGASGVIERHKARLVAKGFHQQEGVDFVDNFSPVAKMVTVKAILALESINSWSLIQLDVNNAFLNGDLEEEVYMDILLGYKVEGEFLVGTKLACKLHKSIYGLKQTSRQWNTKFSNFMLSIGFSQSRSDYSLFHKGHGQDFVALLVYVDDIIFTGASKCGIAKLKDQLSNTFKLKDLGDLKFFLGLEVIRSEEGILLSQRRYVLQLLEDSGMLASKPVKEPMDPRHVLTDDDGDLLTDASQYRRMIGRLLYLTITRPDVCFAVQKLSQYVSQPRTGHMQAVKHLLRYLKEKPGSGVFYSSESSLQIQAYCDSDWGKCMDSRRSSTESEYRAMAVATCELVWIKQLLKDLDVPHSQSILLFCDNKSARKIASNPTFHERTKHIDIDCHFVREKVMDKLVRLVPIESAYQLADALTKPLSRPQLQFLLSKMNLQNPFSPRSS